MTTSTMLMPLTPLASQPSAGLRRESVDALHGLGNQSLEHSLMLDASERHADSCRNPPSYSLDTASAFPDVEFMPLRLDELVNAHGFWTTWSLSFHELGSALDFRYRSALQRVCRHCLCEMNLRG